MTLQQLEYIVAVYRHKHFAKAAENCNVTQPTLSSMVQKLEDELSVKIFDRKTNPITVTPIGRLVVAHTTACSQDKRDRRRRETLVDGNVQSRYSAYDCTLSDSSFLTATDAKIP